MQIEIDIERDRKGWTKFKSDLKERGKLCVWWVSGWVYGCEKKGKQGDRRIRKQKEI